MEKESDRQPCREIAQATRWLAEEIERRSKDEQTRIG